MGAEDFGLFGRGGVPTMMFRIGTTPENLLKEAKARGEAIAAMHGSRYYPDPVPSIRDRSAGRIASRPSANCCRRGRRDLHLGLGETQR